MNKVSKTVKLSRVSIYSKDKEGKPLMGKFGPYEKCLISFKSDKGEDVQASTFVKRETKETLTKWKEGDTVTALFWKNGDFVNFDLPSEQDLLGERVKSLEDRVKALEVYISDRDVISEDVDPSEVPDFTGESLAQKTNNKLS